MALRAVRRNPTHESGNQEARNCPKQQQSSYTQKLRVSLETPNNWAEFSLGLKSRMEYTLSETIEEKGPTSFSRKTLSEHPNLFAERSALFFTPTDRLPSRSIGVGDLDVFLPLCTPGWYDCFFIRSYMSP